VPAALIGRLAVSNTAQGQGVGKMLLADAIKRTLTVSDQIAIYANDSFSADISIFNFSRCLNIIHTL
jgi:predicted GNAT family N-acyltransferase